MSYCLTVNKTKLFRLVKGKLPVIPFDLPLAPMRTSQHYKSRSGSHHLEWYTQGKSCHAALMLMGGPKLVVSAVEDGVTLGWETISLSVEELREMGMVEECERRG